MTESSARREARRQYMRTRQTTVFSFVAAVLVVALVISLMFFFHAFGLGTHESAAVQPNYGVVAPCAPKDAAGNTATYVSTDKISVRVLNGTQHAGLAQAVGEALDNRKFNITTISSFTSDSLDRTTIYFGINAIPAAYTLASDFTDARMVMDNRKDALIDVAVGATFNDLKDVKNVPAVGSQIANISGCEDAAKMTNLPAAIKHDAV